VPSLARKRPELNRDKTIGADATDVAFASHELSRFYCYFRVWFQSKRPIRQGLIEELTAEEIAGNKMMASGAMALRAG